MARGTALEILLQMLRDELRLAISPALSKNVASSHQHYLRSAQTRLWADFEWPFKKVFRDKVLAAGQRYYAPPADLELEGIQKVNILYNGFWSLDLPYGITQQDYNAFNPDTNARLDPALKWQFFNDPDSGDMIEFWPPPASDSVTARFTGIKKLAPLVSMTDKADLDDLLVVLYASADLVPRDDQRKQLAKAQDYFQQLTTKKLSHTPMFVMGGGCEPRRVPRAQIVITPLSSGG